MRIACAVKFLMIVFFIVSVSNACVLPVKRTTTNHSDIFSLINLPQPAKSAGIFNLVSEYLSTITNGNGNTITKPEIQYPEFHHFGIQNRHYKQHKGRIPVISEISVSQRFHSKHSPGSFLHYFHSHKDSKAVPENKPSVLLSFGAFALIALGFIRKQKNPS